MIVRGRRFKGGYRFKHFEGEPKDTLVEAGVPEEVVIPLKQGFGYEVPSVVKKGDTVKAGQIIGIDENSVSTPVQATINGTVKELKKIKYIDGTTNSVVIKSDGTTDWQTVDHEGEWSRLSEEALERRLYMSGVTSLGRSGIPTRYRSSVIGPGEVEHIVVQGLSTDVHNTSFSVLLDGEGVDRFLEGLKILKRVMPKAAVHVTFDKSRMSLVKLINEKLTGQDGINIYPLELKYPQELDEVIVPTILNARYPYGYLPAHMGVIVLNVQAVLRVYDAVAGNKPMIERVIALRGPGFTENQYATVRVGSPLQSMKGWIKDERSLRFVVDNLLTGFSCTDSSLPIGRSFNSIIAIPEQVSGGFLSFAAPGFTKDSYSRTFVSSFVGFKKKVNTNIHGEERPCIFCGYCEDVCPVGITPHLIYHNVERNKIEEKLAIYRIFNCIDCNLCTYVCPSKIQIASYIKEGKKKLRDSGLDESTVIFPNFHLKGIQKSIDTYKGTAN